MCKSFLTFYFLLNVVLTGDPRIPQPWNTVEITLLSAISYWWYYTDKAQQDYRAGKWLNITVAGCAIIGIPLYLFYSRTLRQAGMAFLIFLLIVVGISVSFIGGVGAAIIGVV